MSDEHEDLIQFAEEDVVAAPSHHAEDGWRLLIIDDEDQVHQATRFALKDTLILGRPLTFFSAHSAAEARQMLSEAAPFAVILLDVVMESEDAGLQLVSFIRDTCKDHCVRIILRTGQPGYAPEVAVIQQYDINDYKSKSELTRNRLITTLTAALRSYQQIKAIETSRKGLTLIIGAASDLFKRRAVHKFAQGVVMQLCSLLQIEEEGFICCHFEGADDHTLKILAGAGTYAQGIELHLSEADADQDPLLRFIREVYRHKQSLFLPDRVVLYIKSPQGDELVVHVYTRLPMNELDQKLLELFSINIAVGFDNARMFEQIEKLAFSDSLTGLPNHASLTEAVAQRLKQGLPCALVIFDLDNFQAVNDGLGRSVGDQVLQALANRLQAAFNDVGFVARIAGDSFAVLFYQQDAQRLDQHIHRFLKQFEESVDIDDNDIPLSLTAGLAIAPQHGQEATSLLQNAGIALKHAKRTQRAACCTFDVSFELDLQKRLRIGRELRHCVERAELLLHYQPQISLRTGQVIGAEALVRWRRDSQLVPPMDFIPVAENSGHIIPMGAWILEEACRTQVQWCQELGKNLVMAVNLSIRQLKDPDFFSLLDAILQRTGINPKCLELEVTESMMMDDTETLRGILGEIRRRGIQVAIDDFGTGYSSLSYLQQLPVDRLKIDQSFVTGINERPEDQVIAALVVEMGHLLQLSVIAEGVENEAQEAQLRKLGCDDVQGYFYARPIESHAFVAFVQRYGGVG